MTTTLDDETADYYRHCPALTFQDYFGIMTHNFSVFTTVQ